MRVSDAVIDGWLAKLDKVYDAYTELFDFFVPFGGRKMIVLSKQIDAWAYAGYPIEWNRDYVASTLDEVVRYDNAVFGIMHEMGHNFAPGNYVTPGLTVAATATGTGTRNFSPTSGCTMRSAGQAIRST